MKKTKTKKSNWEEFVQQQNPKPTWWQKHKVIVSQISIVLCLAVLIISGIKAGIRMKDDPDPQFVHLKLINVNTGAVIFRDLSAEYQVGDMFELLGPGDSSAIFNCSKVVVIGRTSVK